MNGHEALDFFMLCGLVKRVQRAGWVRHGLANVESVADHMYRMSLMTFLALDDPNLDASRCIKMALAHDLGEGLVGDITPHDGITDEDKHARELAAFEAICAAASAGSSGVGRALFDLWREYEAGVSAEAVFVKDCDKCEMLVQAFEYERSQGVRLDDFFTSTAPRIATPQARAWLAALLERRDAHANRASSPPR